MKVQMQNARIAFAQGLFKATALQEGQTKKFGASFIIEKGKTKIFMVNPDGKKVATTMENVLEAVAEETWPGVGKKMLNALESNKKCYREGSKHVDKAGDIYAGFEGNMYVSAKNTRRPALFDRDLTPLTEESGKPYSGCYGTVNIEVYGLKDATKKGIHASLSGVQFTADGESLGGGGSVATETDFEPIAAPDDDFLAD